ncbi:MAG TPA: DUF4097 family beta strand repeat-containing protein [Vicinamibacterales bacterium]|jgi:DUF4097 and DUF4098 domain-containing protein YvlB
MLHRHFITIAFRLIAVAALTGSALPAAAQQRAERGFDTDRTVAVTRGSRLAISNHAGEVVIRSWDKDSLRIQARHSSKTVVDVQTTANLVTIRSRGGPSGAVDFDITAPTWMPLKVSGTFIYIGIEGAQNEVSAETVHGDIVIKGGAGTITAKSIQGDIIVEDAKGRISLNAVNENIRVTGASGEITAENTNGDIIMTKVDARSAEIATVNGDIRYEGTVSSGPYRMSTHNGDITMVLPETTNATFTVRTYNGDFNSNLPTKVVGDVRRGRRTTYTLGTGAADVELESFGGSIRVRRPGTVAPVRSKDKDQ